MHPRLLAGLALLAVACLLPACRPHPGPRGALDRLKADRIGVAVVLAQHPGLERALHAEFARPVNGMRLEWSDQSPLSGAPAEHEWDGPGRRIVVRASPDLPPGDQLLAVFFELANARSLPLFLALERDAVAGRVGRDDFPDEMVRIEHGTVVAAKHLFPGLLPLSESERERHRLYADLLRAPEDFDAFLEWRRQEFAEGYARNRELYLRQYDELMARGVPADPAAAPAPRLPAPRGR